MSYKFDKVIDRRVSNSVKWTKFPEDTLPLWVADMDFRAPEPVLEALRLAIEHGVLGYELPSLSLQEVVAARMNRLYGWKVEPEMVVSVPGIVSGFNAAARAVCSPGEGILMQPPVYFPFLSVPENAGLARQYSPLVSVADQNILHYEPDFDAFEAAIKKNGIRTRMFLMCHPHNPTGTVFSKDQLSRLAEICLEHEIIICSDEIHSELYHGCAAHVPVATLSTEVADNSITLIAPSKTFNLAGLFCGFAIIPNPDLRKRYQQATERMTLHVNSLGQLAAQVAFSGACDGWLEEVRAYLTGNRDFLVDFVQKELPELRLTLPGATYLSWLDFNPQVDAGKITGSPYEYFLERAKVVLSDGSQFGPGGDGFVRLNFACPRSILEEALKRMRESLS